MLLAQKLPYLVLLGFAAREMSCDFEEISDDLRNSQQ